MNTITPLIQEFFADFERAGNSGDTAVSLSQFHDPYMHLGPDGMHIITREIFRAAIDKRKTFFASLGLKSTKMEVVEETALDDIYTLVKVKITMHFEKTGKDAVDVEQYASYLLSLTNEKLEVVLYLNHSDLMTLMKSAGLMS